MRLIIFLFAVFFIFLPLVGFSYSSSFGLLRTTLSLSNGSPATDLRQMIEEKSKELEEIQNQKKEVEKNVEEISRSANTLQKEIKLTEANINQLDLSIKTNKVIVEKLGLELLSLEENLQNIENNIQNNQKTIAKIFFELQQKDRENFLIILLKNQRLSESMAEIRTAFDLNGNLAFKLGELKNLQEELNQNLEIAKNKKQEREVEQINLTNRQSILQDQKSFKKNILTQTKNQEKIYQQQLQNLQKIQDEISEEIGRIEEQLRKTIDPNLLPLPRAGVLGWPVKNVKISQNYGSTAFAKKNYKSQWHNGIDLGGLLGAEILAAEEGTVINVGDQDKYCRGGAYGKFIVIKHTNGLTTLYAHMSKTLVAIDQQVRRGEIIGYLGKTGWSTGPHLHFTVFASHTLTPAKPGFPEGTQSSRVCGLMPVGGDLDPTKYL